MKVKFLCLNLWQGGNLMEDIFEFIKKENPDILALQEVYDGHNPKWDRKYRSMEVFNKELSYKYSHFAPAYLDNRDIGKIEYGNAVFSKFPIKSSKVVFYDIPYRDDYVEKFENFPLASRNLQQVTLDLKGKELNVFNTQGIWGKDGEDSESRFQMSETIISEIKDKDNVILAGDFNLRDTTQAVKGIEKHLLNIFRGESKTSFNMKRKIKAGVKSFAAFERPEVADGYAESVVDMVLVSKNMKIIDHKYAQVDISDHLPLVVILEL